MCKVTLKTTKLKKSCEAIVEEYAQQFEKEYIKDTFLRTLNEKYSWWDNG